ncbi:archaeosortase/exosortase family protein [Cytophaga aurantiaca]|uniref:archaeosortase/exosortase family protein n=1 Tax=Cytophaga aurantiaca TaxID=29530 RepID=UPI00037A58C0|nr:archaeosortase/exosortase family protein [Cytophaga aurantiaca]
MNSPFIRNLALWYKAQDERYRLFFLFAFKAVFFYFFFDAVITTYVGLVTPGGIESKLLMQWNVLDWFVMTIVSSSYYLLSALQFNVFKNGDIVGIIGTGGIGVGYYCIGYYVWMTIAVLVGCFPGKWKVKLYYILASILIIHFVNIIRISLLAVLAQYDIDLEDQHIIYNYIIYGITALLFLGYVEWFSNRGEEVARW